MLIPMTILVRYVIIKEKPTKYQSVSVIVIIVGVLINVVPTIFNLDESGINGRGHQTKFNQFFWVCVFIASFIPAAFMNVYGEVVLKKNEIKLEVFLFWTSLYQVLTDLTLFWLDIIPGFGSSSGVGEFGSHLKNGFIDTAHSPQFAIMFIGFYCISYIGSNGLIRNSEGATWSAIVGIFTSPICVMFWFLFKEKPFSWDPHFPTYGICAVVGTIIMTAGSYYYNKHINKKDFVRIPLLEGYV